MSTIEELSSKRLCFSVTSGRSGTKLLATLLRQSAGLNAEHEPAPRFNYVLRSILGCPEAARWWLLTEKLPAIARSARAQPTYAELSHLTCKGFIEPLLDTGLRPAFIILARPAREVASSLFRIGAVPERTGAGRLVLIGPSDSHYLPLPDWQGLSDYQLCYWYAREIEYRQSHYREVFRSRAIDWLDCSFSDVLEWSKFIEISTFISGSNVEPDQASFERLLGQNQNARGTLLNGVPEPELPVDLGAQESEVETLIAKTASAGAASC